MDPTQAGFWWNALAGDVHKKVFAYVQSVEQTQRDIYERFLKLAALYDPYETLGMTQGVDDLPGRNANVTENVVASNVDTVAAIIAKWAGRATFQTDEGDWSTQRQARTLEMYAEGLVKRARVHELGPIVFKSGAIFGTAPAKVYAGGDGQIRVERILPDELIADQNECRNGKPKQLHHRARVDRELLISEFPEYEEEILKSSKTQDGVYGRWAGYLPYDINECIVIESWRLPIGKRGEKGYKPGRHTIATDMVCLLDEEYHLPRFPIAVFRWNPRITGFYGRGLAEDIAGHQRMINKLNWQEDQILDLHAVPTTYVAMPDLPLMAKVKPTQFGRIVPFKVQAPETKTPQGLSNQVTARREQIKQSSYDFAGVSRLASHGMKPAGVESGAAMREYQDITTERFALQERAYERWFLDVVELMLMVAKDMDENGDGAPVVSYRTRHLNKRIKWRDVDMGDIEVQIQAASSLSRTLSGRYQTVIEWAQAGVITQDEARSLMQHPDLPSVLSLYTAAREDLERCVEAIIEGETLVPEPYQNLKMGVWLFQMKYLKALNDGAPEEVLERLRTWIVQAAWMQKTGGGQAPGPMPMDAGAAMAMPAAPVDQPLGPAPAAAFAPTAMQVMPT